MGKSPKSLSQHIQTEKYIKAIQKKLKTKGLDAYLIPSTDEHLNEYLPENKKRREWMSGFTGSAGDLLITEKEGWLFADSRYHEQADKEVPKIIRVSKLGLQQAPTVTEKIRELAQKKKAYQLGLDPFTLSVSYYQTLEKQLATVKLVPTKTNWVDEIVDFEKTQPVDTSEVFSIPQSVTGLSIKKKLEKLKNYLINSDCDVITLTKLEQIAWLFNLRGQDIPYNPVFISYAIVTPKKAYLFVNRKRVVPSVLNQLEKDVELLAYQDYPSTLKKLCQKKTILIAPSHNTYGTYHLVKKVAKKISTENHPVEILKAEKNRAEIAAMKTANLKASNSKVRALVWLSKQQTKAINKAVTEETFRQRLEQYYAEEPKFMGLSFNTIAGAGRNSSIVHYSTPNPRKKLNQGELFLVDSGAHYMGGTTDDTRTIIIGKPSQEHRFYYTEVLKAHINCAMQRFPKGTNGITLDAITRANLWNNGVDFGHGTGHGVGAFLNVHEGPNGIHKRASQVLLPGMVTSIEPGFYKPGWGGIRLENLYVVQALKGEHYTDGRPIYQFEPLTYIPFDRQLINRSALSLEQLNWLKNYHDQVLEKIGPKLNKAELYWLKKACKS